MMDVLDAGLLIQLGPAHDIVRARPLVVLPETKSRRRESRIQSCKHPRIHVAVLVRAVRGHGLRIAVAGPTVRHTVRLVDKTRVDSYEYNRIHMNPPGGVTTAIASPTTPHT